MNNHSNESHEKKNPNGLIVNNLRREICTRVFDRKGAYRASIISPSDHKIHDIRLHPTKRLSERTFRRAG
jgi:hypothetical protein